MKKQTIYFLKGLPASGKSTWAKQKIHEDKEKGIITKRVNKDDLRAMLDDSLFSKGRENFVLKVRDFIIQTSLQDGCNVIVDDTNFHEKHLNAITGIISDLNYIPIDLEEKFFNTPVEECIQRDKERQNSVGEKVILDMYDKYIKEEVKYDPDLPDCIIVDVDGTLAIRGNRSPFGYWKAQEDELNKPVADLLYDIQHTREEHLEDLNTIIMTGRENLVNEYGYTIKNLTEDWLKRNSIHYDNIFIRENRDHRSDFEVKKEMFEDNIKGKFNVLYVIDDRLQVINMWRSLGLTVLDVAGHRF